MEGRSNESAGLLAELRRDKSLVLPIVLLMGVSLVLRLVNLGYSDLQGDEILALCRVSEHQSLIHFLAYLLAQLKGPVQYVITCAVSLFDPTFSSELVLRLPFAIANLLSLACFFLVVYRLFSLRVAVYASFLLGTNGIFIAFARMVQYQSFVLLGGLAGILCLTLALQQERWKVIGLYLASLATAMSLLAHFDAAFFLPPMAVLVLHWWLKYRNRSDFHRLRAHLIAAVLLFVFLVLAFYVEYALRLDYRQLSYWERRRVGDSTNVVRLFQFYNPGPVLWFCLGWVLLGLTRIRASLPWQVLLAWCLPPIVFMTLLFKDSRTHAYTYILPLTIIAGIGVDVMTGWLTARLRNRFIPAVRTVTLLLFLMFSYINFQIFVDHHIEYPWYPKHVLGMEFKGGFVAGTFGFPYSREWRQMAQWFQNLPEQEVSLVTNEKRQFVSFYLPSKVRHRLKYVTGDFPGQVSAPQGMYILIVQGPQSWTRELWGLSLSDWHKMFTPLHEFANEDGRVLASVYFLTQEQIDTEFH